MDDHKIQAFKEWLIVNGASFPKIDWPSDATVIFMFYFKHFCTQKLYAKCVLG